MDLFEVLIGVVILVTIGITATTNLIDPLVNAQSITNESATMTLQTTGTGYNGTVVLANENILSGSDVVSNYTEALTRDTDYTIDVNNGELVVITNYSEDGSALNVSYNYEATGYQSSQSTRSITVLITLFVALAAIVMLARFAREQQ